MKSWVLGVLIGSISALLLAYFCASLVGYTAAIVTPQGYFELAKALSAQWIFMVVWEVFVVQFLGAILPCFLLCYCVLKFLSFNKTTFVVAFLSVYIFFTYVFNIYVMEFQNYNYELTAWLFMHPTAIVLGLVTALFFTKQQHH